MMIGWRSRRRLTRLVSGVRVPATTDIAALCAAVAERLDRPVQLLGVPLPVDAPCGLVITTGQSHYVAYDNQTTPLHQRHIVAHELGHLLAGHATGPLGQTELSRLLMPTLDPRMVAGVLARAPGYDVRAEAEAEIIADLLWRRTRSRATGSVTMVDAADPSTAAAMDRIHRTLAGE